MEVLRQALAWSRAKRLAALVTVVHTSGSTPRHRGAKMVVDADGHIAGTIGGGRIELEAIAAARQVAGGQRPAHRVRHHLVRDLAMCCGGSMDLWIQPVPPSVDALAQALNLYDHRRPAELISFFDGRAAMVREIDGHGSRKPQLDDECFVESIWPADRVLLFGLGHVARALGPALRTVGFQVVVCDDNDTGALDTVPNWADRGIASFDLADIERELGPLGAGDYLIIMTRDHAEDQRILERALTHPRLSRWSYLGLIGSLGKIGRFRKRLEAKGIANPDNWARLHAPIGLDIAAESPEEIAVAVTAELIALRNRPPEDDPR